MIFALIACAPKAQEESILIINTEEFVGEAEELAKGLSILKSYSPKIIAIDLQFSDEDQRSTELIDVLGECGNIVMRSEIEGYEERLEEYPNFKTGILPKLPPNAKTGFVSLIQENDAFFTVKKFSSWERVNGNIEYQFGVRTAISLDSAKAMDFVRTHPKINDINFHSGKKFKTFEITDIINGKVSKVDIEDKIVLLGLLGPGFTDRFYSGAIERGNGSFVPDMFSAEFHAHIILQILSE